MPKFCSSCLSQGHITSVCPWGQRETLPTQVQSRPDSVPGRPPAVRRNASKSSSSSSHINSTSASLISSHTPLPHDSSTPTNQSEPTLSKDPPQLDETRSSTLPPPPQASAAPPSISYNEPHPQSNNPNSPNKSSSVPPSCRPSVKQKRKKVTFRMDKISPQPNVEANTLFWEAVNRQVSIIDPARLTGSPANQPHLSITQATVQKPADSIPSSSNTKLPTMSPSTSDSESSLAAESPPSSPPPIPNGTQNDAFSLQPSSYHSEGEDMGTEEACFQGHLSDDMSNAKPRNSKRNKRHPDQPLKVQLRVRKDQNPSS